MLISLDRTPPTVWALVDRRVCLLVFDGAPTRRSVTRRLGTLVVLIGYSRA